MNTIDDKLNSPKNPVADRNNFNALSQQAGTKTIKSPNGTLVRNQGILKGLANDTAEIGQDVKNLATAVTTGKSNDHSLGKLNDLGLKVGGAGIAAYLLSKRTTKSAKGMELIGLAAFMAAMQVFPKLFIQTPLNLKNGFDINQKYIDNQGRKKNFFSDNQFLPWDLWSKEEINKIGDHMGVDKDIKDREELTKRKMQTAALQGNTLMMLTSGPAAPLMAALACNRAEEPLRKFHVWNELRVASNDFKNMDTIVEGAANNSKFSKDAAKKLKVLFSQYQGGELNDEFYQKVGKIINPVEILKKNADDNSIKVALGMSFDEAGKETAEIVKELCKKAGPGKEFEEILKYNSGEAAKSRAKVSVLGRLANALAGEKLESHTALTYNNVEKTLIKRSGFKLADLGKAKRNGKDAEKMITEYLQKIADNAGATADGKNGTIEQFIASIGKPIADLDKTFGKSDDATSNIGKLLAKLGGKTRTEQQFGASLEEFVKSSKKGVDNSLLRNIMALGYEKTLKTGVNLPEENVLKVAREIIYNGTYTSLAEPKVVAERMGASLGECTQAIAFLKKGALDDPAIEQALKKAGLFDSYKNAAEEMFDVVGSRMADTKTKAASVGKSVTELFQDAASQAFNNKTWMKIFGGASLVLAGITLVAVSLLGRSKKEDELYRKAGNNAVK